MAGETTAPAAKCRSFRRPSIILSPPRSPFISEGGKTFFRLGGAALLGVHRDQRFELGIAEMTASKVECVRLGLSDRVGCVREQVVDHARAGGHQFVRRHDLMHEADASHLRSVEAYWLSPPLRSVS